MISPITGKEMQVQREAASLSFRKEDFNIAYHFYECEDSKERFTDDFLDQLNVTQVHNLYREKYGIPFPEEIRKIRSLYEVSANKMSEILGLGTNTYRLYEAGEMPSVANGRLILSVKQPKEFIKQVKASSHLLSEKESNKIIQTSESLIRVREARHWDYMFTNNLFEKQIPGELNGYRCPDLARISNMISFFHEREIELYKTKLNKLLFYSDFYAYMKSGYSISGLSYRAIQRGPVPTQYQKMYVKLCDDEKITIDEVPFPSGNYGEMIISKDSFDESYFSETELNVLGFVAQTFGSMKTSDLVERSHQEQAWKENEKEKSYISYQKFAFELIKQWDPAIKVTQWVH